MPRKPAFEREFTGADREKFQALGDLSKVDTLGKFYRFLTGNYFVENKALFYQARTWLIEQAFLHANSLDDLVTCISLLFDPEGKIPVFHVHGGLSQEEFDALDSFYHAAKEIADAHEGRKPLEESGFFLTMYAVACHSIFLSKPRFALGQELKLEFLSKYVSVLFNLLQVGPAFESRAVHESFTYLCSVYPEHFGEKGVGGSFYGEYTRMLEGLFANQWARAAILLRSIQAVIECFPELMRGGVDIQRATLITTIGKYLQSSDSEAVGPAGVMSDAEAKTALGALFERFYRALGLFLKVTSSRQHFGQTNPRQQAQLLEAMEVLGDDDAISNFRAQVSMKMRTVFHPYDDSLVVEADPFKLACVDDRSVPCTPAARTRGTTYADGISKQASAAGFKALGELSRILADTLPAPASVQFPLRQPEPVLSKFFEANPDAVNSGAVAAVRMARYADLAAFLDDCGQAYLGDASAAAAHPKRPKYRK